MSICVSRALNALLLTNHRMSNLYENILFWSRILINDYNHLPTVAVYVCFEVVVISRLAKICTDNLASFNPCNFSFLPFTSLFVSMHFILDCFTLGNSAPCICSGMCHVNLNYDILKYLHHTYVLVVTPSWAILLH